MLSNNDIMTEIKNNNILITPWNADCLSVASYNVTASYFAMSIKKGVLERIHVRKDKYGNTIRYINIKPNDTVLILTEEYLSVSGEIAGNVISRVTMVSKGFGHISTTIDPFWNGALLIALSNPFSSTIKLHLHDENNLNNKLQIATLTFNYLKPPATKSINNKEINNSDCQDTTVNNEENAANLHSDKLSARMDILKKYSNSPKLLSKLFNRSMYKCTIDVMEKMDAFPNYSTAAEDVNIQTLHNKWEDHINKINKMILTNAKTEKGIIVSKNKIFLMVIIILAVVFVCMKEISMAALIVAIGPLVINNN